MNCALVASLLLLQLLAWASCEECPPPEDISPCKCIYQSKMAYVTCKGGSWKDVNEAFDGLRGRTADLFVTFWNVKGDRLPSDLFRGTNVHMLRIDSCDLVDLLDMDGRPAFTGLEHSLHYLEVYKSIKGANQLKTISLSHLELLKDFNLLGNNILEVENGWFAKGPFRMEHISISNCGSCRIGDAAFAPLVNLKSLTLSRNGLTAIQRSMFPNPGSQLELWILDYNNLTSLPNDIFSGMTSLKEVDLAENSIRRLEETTWSSVWEKLYIIDIYDNPLECDSHMEWMFKLKKAWLLIGTCASPDSQKDVELEDFIKSNRKSSDRKNLIWSE